MCPAGVKSSPAAKSMGVHYKSYNMYKNESIFFSWEKDSLILSDSQKKWFVTQKQ